MSYLRNLWTALESGWRAGRRQFRERLTELRKTAPAVALPLFPEITE